VKKLYFLPKLLLILTLACLYSCLNGDGELNNRVISLNPFGTQIILVNDNVPGAVFGNLCDEIQIQITANEELTPDGSTVFVELNSSDLPTNLQGCITGADNLIIDGMAFLEMFSGLFIDQTPRVQDETEIANVNVSVTVTTPGGDPQSEFLLLDLKPVRLIPPDDQQIETLPLGDPNFIFLPLEFDTEGLPPGTIVSFAVEDPTLGMIDPTFIDVPVIGSLPNGQAITQYNTFNGTGGVQTLTATVILPDPATKDPICPSVPLADRTIVVVVIIIQSAPELIMEICEDLIDNNFNGLVDCADPECPAGSGCTMGDSMTGVCSGGVCI